MNDSTNEFHVPVIDISSYTGDGTAEEKAAVAAQVDAAAREVGFIQLTGHGVDRDTWDGLASALDAFFLRDLEVKKRVTTPPEINRGYSAPKSERLSLSLGVESATGMNDFFEAFNIGVQSSDFPDLGLPEADYPENVWPAESEGGMAEFRGNLERWFAAAQEVAETLTVIFEDSLELPRGTITSLADHSIDVLRSINYALDPGQTVELDGDLTGMGEHTDYGIVTVLWADRVAGLQVLGSDGSWHDVLPEPGALLVNLGDVTARLTNDQWKSTLHRVRPPVVDGTIMRRRSAAFFHDGNVDAVVGPLPGMVDAEHPARYEPMTVGEHVARKLAGSRSLESNSSGTSRESERVLSSKR
ncbi:MAG: isopenicillin N synthase family dioxygenase [Mycobacteriaceae bacterium]|uniref:isopenicillin N synthase family dioxygenase n=1 Tax=Corynebacterium sp. TaxID=1720 RepID=UPI003F96B5C1